MSLYRKYRPASFSEVVGQDHVTEPLSVALSTGRINHAYLFSGPRGCGKTSSARILARSLNCVDGPTDQPCGECDSCVALAPGGPGNLDVTELDAASHGGVDDTRDLRERAFFAPASSRYRVLIIDEAHMVTNAGFNALLKIVEEPPEHLIFIFATTEPEKVLPTIRSRTHHYPFRLLTPTAMRGLLERVSEQEGVAVEDSVLPLVIRAGGGSPRDTLSVLDQLMAGSTGTITYHGTIGMLGATEIALIDATIDALATSDGASLFETVDEVVEAGHDPRRFVGDVLQRLRDLLMIQSVPQALERGLVEAPGDQAETLRRQAGSIGQATLTRFADLVHDGMASMRGATSPRLLLEVLCAKLLLPVADDSVEALAQRVEMLERGMTTPAPASTPSAGGGAPVAVGEIPAAAGGARATDGAPASGGGEPPRFVRKSQQPRPPEPEHVPAGESAAGEEPVPAGESAASEPATAGPVAEPAAPVSGPDPAEPSEQAASAPPEPVPAASAPSPQAPTAAADPAAAPAPEPESELTPESATAPPSAESDPAPAPERAEATAAPEPEPEPEPAAESVPESTEQPPTAGAPGLDRDRLEAGWKEVRAAVRERTRTVEVMLAEATVRTVEGDTVHLSHHSVPLANRLDQGHNASVIADAVGQVFGGSWIVRCAPAGQAPPASDTPSGTAGSSGAGRSSGAAGPPGGGPPAGPTEGAPGPVREFRRPSQARQTPPAGPADAPPPEEPGPPDDDPGADSGVVMPDRAAGASTPPPPDPPPAQPAPPPEEMTEDEALDEARYGERNPDHRTPEDMALQLLKDHLGATPLDR